MNKLQLPAIDEMYAALVRRDREFEGVFFVGVKTTGVLCRPTCSARKPLKRNVVFFSNIKDGLAAGYRPCRRCKPMEVAGSTPQWIQGLLKLVDKEPAHRIRDCDLRNMNLQPEAVRRWFNSNHGMTFQTYQRTRRLGVALKQIAVGQDALTAGLDIGYESSSGFRDAFQRMFGTTPKSNGQQPRTLLVNRILTPLGPMIAAASEQSLFLLEFADRRMLQTQIDRLGKHLNCVFVPGVNEPIEQISDELARYFVGQILTLETPIELPGTQFQQQVWQRLMKIPPGETISYERLARDIDRPGAQRAVGRANGDNRLAIVVPCHRVVRSDGTLCGYGGGIYRKQWLLDLERK